MKLLFYRVHESGFIFIFISFLAGQTLVIFSGEIGVHIILPPQSRPQKDEKFQVNFGIKCQIN